MYVYFEKDGVLTIKPEDHSEAMTLKWFLNEFSTHGARMINIETEYEEDDQESDNPKHGRNMYSYRGYYPEPYFDQKEYDRDVEGDYWPQYPKHFEITSERDGRGGRRGDASQRDRRNGRGRNR